MNSILPQNTDNIIHFHQFRELQNHARVIREHYRYSSSLLAVKHFLNTDTGELQLNQRMESS